MEGTRVLLNDIDTRCIFRGPGPSVLTMMCPRSLTGNWADMGGTFHLWSTHNSPLLVMTGLVDRSSLMTRPFALTNRRPSHSRSAAWPQGKGMYRPSDCRSIPVFEGMERGGDRLRRAGLADEAAPRAGTALPKQSAGRYRRGYCSG